MNFFCRLFGHTWWPETRVAQPSWNTTKEGHVLVASPVDQPVQHVLVCKRCGEERPDAPRRHDADHPVEQPERVRGTLG